MKFSDPFKILSPTERWPPKQSQMDAFQNAYEKLLPPLVYKIRLEVAKWREESYKGASAALVRVPTNHSPTIIAITIFYELLINFIKLLNG